MAHGNPEFALGLMHRDTAPVRYATRPPASHAALRARMDALVLIPAASRTPDEQRAVDLWIMHCRQAREAGPVHHVAPPSGEAMHGGHARGERFIEPKRRWHPNVQNGREKARRGTLPR